MAWPLLLADRSPARVAAASATTTRGGRALLTRRPPPLLLTGRAAAAPTTAEPPNAQRPPDDHIAGLSVRVAKTAAELRAAAYLRAAAFGSYPPGRSEYAARQHRRMRGDAEWEAVTAKTEGKDPAYARLAVMCLIATAPVPSPHAAVVDGRGSSESDDKNNAALAARLAAEAELEPSAALLPAAAATTEAVIGTLDVNVGAVLPAEELIGRRGRVGESCFASAPSSPSSSSAGAAAPQPPPPASTRAYLSNVCVAKAARGLGVGKALLRAAEDLLVRPADQGGMLRAPPPSTGDGDDQKNNCDGENDGDADTSSSFHLYVHVVHDNAAARALYEGGGGFRVEAEETEAFARGLARPRRLLLHKRLRLPPAS